MTKNKILSGVAASAFAMIAAANFASADMMSGDSNANYASGKKTGWFASVDLGVQFFDAGVKLGLQTVQNPGVQVPTAPLFDAFPTITTQPFDINVTGSSATTITGVKATINKSGQIALSQDLAGSEAGDTTYTFPIPSSLVFATPISGASLNNQKTALTGYSNLLIPVSGTISAPDTFTYSDGQFKITIPDTNGTPTAGKAITNGTAIATITSVVADVMIGGVPYTISDAITNLTTQGPLVNATPSTLSPWANIPMNTGAFAGFSWQVSAGYYITPCVGVDLAVGTYSGKRAVHLPNSTNDNNNNNNNDNNDNNNDTTTTTASARFFNTMLMPEIFYEYDFNDKVSLKLIGGLGGSIVNAKYGLGTLSRELLLVNDITYDTAAGTTTNMTAVLPAMQTIPTPPAKSATINPVNEQIAFVPVGGNTTNANLNFTSDTEMTLNYRFGLQLSYNMSECTSLGLKYYVGNQGETSTKPQRMTITQTDLNAGADGGVQPIITNANVFWSSKNSFSQAFLVNLTYRF